MNFYVQDIRHPYKETRRSRESLPSIQQFLIWRTYILARMKYDVPSLAGEEMNFPGAT